MSIKINGNVKRNIIIYDSKKFQFVARKNTGTSFAGNQYWKYSCSNLFITNINDVSNDVQNISNL